MLLEQLTFLPHSSGAGRGGWRVGEDDVEQRNQIFIFHQHARNVSLLEKDPPPFSVSLKIENSSFFEGTGDHECIRNNVSVLRVGFRSISEACKPTNIIYSENLFIFRMENYKCNFIILALFS